MTNSATIFQAWQHASLTRLDPTVPSAPELAAALAAAAGDSGKFRGRIVNLVPSEWWVTPSNNLHGVHAACAELIVARVGALLGAPTCEAELVRIGPAFDGIDSPCGRYILEEGWAVATRDVRDGLEWPVLPERARDDNVVRHAGAIVMWDLCWGGDEQWLADAADDDATWSHDHGWYLRGWPGDWTVMHAEYLAHAEVSHAISTRDGLDPAEQARIEVALGTLDRLALRSIIEKVPPAWPVSDAWLQAVGAFLEVRAQRLAGEWSPP